MRFVKKIIKVLFTKKIYGINLITKLIVSSIIIFLMSWLGFELAYNKMLYENYSKIYTEMITAQENFEKLWKVYQAYLGGVDYRDIENTVD